MSKRPRRSISAQIGEVERELQMRLEVYGRKDQTRGTGAGSGHSQREEFTTLMQAVLGTLEDIRDGAIVSRSGVGGMFLPLERVMIRADPFTPHREVGTVTQRHREGYYTVAWEHGAPTAIHQNKIELAPYDPAIKDERT
jgi:hypothetical protein